MLLARDRELGTILNYFFSKTVSETAFLNVVTENSELKDAYDHLKQKHDAQMILRRIPKLSSEFSVTTSDSSNVL